jgi:CheY-like chemotaxis protein
MKESNTIAESILLVDDNPANLQVLFQTLGSFGCKLLIAKNGEAALAIAQKARPDLILLDIMMPGIDGFEVCRRLKADPATEKPRSSSSRLWTRRQTRCEGFSWVRWTTFPNPSNPKKSSPGSTPT